MAEEPQDGKAQRVDSDTPEGRLWNWIAAEWERVWATQGRQSDRWSKTRELADACRDPEDFYGPIDMAAVKVLLEFIQSGGYPS